MASWNFTADSTPWTSISPPRTPRDMAARFALEPKAPSSVTTDLMTAVAWSTAFMMISRIRVLLLLSTCDSARTRALPEPHALVLNHLKYRRSHGAEHARKEQR